MHEVSYKIIFKRNSRLVESDNSLAICISLEQLKALFKEANGPLYKAQKLTGNMWVASNGPPRSEGGLHRIPIGRSRANGLQVVL